MSTKEQNDALKRTITSIDKQFGKGSIMALLGDGGDGDDDKDGLTIPVIPTGSLGLDSALGIGGYPRGRIIEIYGPESSGKTTLALHAIREVQKGGGAAAFVDAEHGLDVEYTHGIGVDLSKVLISQPEDGEQALDITESLVRSGAVNLVVVDSVAALVPKAELDGEVGDPHTGLQARLMSQALRKLTGIAHRTGTTILFIHRLGLRNRTARTPGLPEHIGYKARELHGIGTWEGPLARTVVEVTEEWSIVGDALDFRSENLDVYLLHRDGTRRVPEGPNIHPEASVEREITRLARIALVDSETTGGNALKFYANVRLDVRRVGQIQSIGEALVMRARVKVVKNKCAPPFREAEFDIRFGEGIDQAGEVFDHALSLGVVTKDGERLSFGKEHLGRSREEARGVLLAGLEMLADIRAAVKEQKS